MLALSIRNNGEYSSTLVLKVLTGCAVAQLWTLHVSAAASGSGRSVLARRGRRGGRRRTNVFAPSNLVSPSSGSKWQLQRTTSGEPRTSARRRRTPVATDTTATTITTTTITKTTRRERPRLPPPPTRPNPAGRRRRTSGTAPSSIRPGEITGSGFG